MEKVDHKSHDGSESRRRRSRNRERRSPRGRRRDRSRSRDRHRRRNSSEPPSRRCATEEEARLRDAKCVFVSQLQMKATEEDVAPKDLGMLNSQLWQM